MVKLSKNAVTLATQLHLKFVVLRSLTICCAVYVLEQFIRKKREDTFYICKERSLVGIPFEW